MKTYQEKWRQKKQKDGNKLVSVWLNVQELQQIEEMKVYYKIENTSDLIKTMIFNQYEKFLSKKESEVKKQDDYDRKLKILMERITNLENKQINQPVPEKKPVKPLQIENKEIILPETPSNKTFEPDEMDKVIIHMFQKGFKGNDITKSLVDNGFTTKTGKTPDRNFVDKRIFYLKKQGLINLSWYITPKKS